MTSTPNFNGGQSRMVRILILSMAVAIPLSACGKRGKNRPPVVAATPMGAPSVAGDLNVHFDRLAEQIIKQLEKEAPSGIKRTLAISDFVDGNGQPSMVGRHIADELTTRLVNSGKAKIVERTLIQKVLDEQRMGASQLVDDDTAARVGKLIGADTLCTGSIMDLGQEVRVNTRLIRANTAEAFGAAAVSLPATSGLRALQGREPVATTAVSNSNDPVIMLRRPIGSVRPQTLAIHNRSAFCLRMELNGVAMRVFEKSQEVTCIPAGIKAFLELPTSGQHTIRVTGSKDPAAFDVAAEFSRSYFFREEKNGSKLLVSDADFQ